MADANRLDRYRREVDESSGWREPVSFDLWEGSLPHDVAEATRELLDKRHAALVCLSGSHAYGTERPGSDFDLRGVYIAETDDLFRLQPPPATLDRGDPDITIHELHKFAKLAAAANPNVLELLWAPVVWASSYGRLLREHRQWFVSKRALKTYGGYATSQLRKAQEGTGGSRGTEHFKREKFVLHLYRLMIQGAGLLRTGELTVRMGSSERDIAAAWAQEPIETLTSLWGRLDAEMVEAHRHSPLPDEPNWAAIDNLLISFRGDLLTRRPPPPATLSL